MTLGSLNPALKRKQSAAVVYSESRVQEPTGFTVTLAQLVSTPDRLPRKARKVVSWIPRPPSPLPTRGEGPLPCLAVYLHGLAGDLALARLRGPSLAAEDLIASLPAAFADLADGKAP